MNKEFLTVREVAKELHTTERTIRELIKKGALKAKKVGTKYIITIQAVRDYLQS
jgi:excisionase family DNA binding protein